MLLPSSLHTAPESGALLPLSQLSSSPSSIISQELGRSDRARKCRDRRARSAQLLAHNVEAYAGMPELFFTWALDTHRRVHYEFLDNSVPQGEPPRTVAYGWNTEMTILDIGRMIDIDRFRKINIHACKPEDVYRDRNLAPEHNVEFMRRCARWIPIINFADYRTGKPYARLQHGKWAWFDERRLRNTLQDPETKAVLSAMASDVFAQITGATEPQINVAAEKIHTLGRWAEVPSEQA